MLKTQPVYFSMKQVDSWICQFTFKILTISRFTNSEYGHKQDQLPVLGLLKQNTSKIKQAPHLSY